MRFQVRKGHQSGLWQVWVLGCRSWIFVEEFHNWMYAARLATGQHPYTGEVFQRTIVTVAG